MTLSNLKKVRKPRWNQRKNHLQSAVMHIFFKKILDTEADRIGEQYSAICCVAPGFSTDSRKRRNRPERTDNQYDPSHHDVLRDGRSGFSG